MLKCFIAFFSVVRQLRGRFTLGDRPRPPDPAWGCPIADTASDRSARLGCRAMAQIQRIGVVGAGFMGSGIAESSARAGVAVRLYEPASAPLEHSRATIEASVARAVKRERLSEDEGADLLSRIEWSTDLDALADAELVVEAIVEDEQIK